MPQLTNADIPYGMIDLMKGLARNVLRERPENIYVFSAEYFENLLRQRDGSLDKGYEKFREYEKRAAELRQSRSLSNSDANIIEREKKGRIKGKQYSPPVDMGVNGVAIQVNPRESKIAKVHSNRKKWFENSKSESKGSTDKEEDETDSKVTQVDNDVDEVFHDKTEELSSENNVTPVKRLRKLSSKKPSQNLIVIKEESPTEDDDTNKTQTAGKMLTEDAAAFIIQKAMRYYVGKSKGQSVEAETPTNDDVTENASLSEANTVIENIGVHTPYSENRDDFSSGTQEYLSEEGTATNTVVITECNEVENNNINNNDLESATTLNMQKMDRLQTPESDSGLSEKSFNLKMQETDENSVDQENVSLANYSEVTLEKDPKYLSCSSEDISNTANENEIAENDSVDELNLLKEDDADNDNVPGNVIEEVSLEQNNLEETNDNGDDSLTSSKMTVPAESILDLEKEHKIDPQNEDIADVDKIIIKKTATSQGLTQNDNLDDSINSDGFAAEPASEVLNLDDIIKSVEKQIESGSSLLPNAKTSTIIDNDIDSINSTNQIRENAYVDQNDGENSNEDDEIKDFKNNSDESSPNLKNPDDIMIKPEVDFIEDRNGEANAELQEQAIAERGADNVQLVMLTTKVLPTSDLSDSESIIEFKEHEKILGSEIVASPVVEPHYIGSSIEKESLTEPIITEQNVASEDKKYKLDPENDAQQATPNQQPDIELNNDIEIETPLTKVNDAELVVEETDTDTKNTNNDVHSDEAEGQHQIQETNTNKTAVINSNVKTHNPTEIRNEEDQENFDASVLETTNEFPYTEPDIVSNAIKGIGNGEEFNKNSILEERQVATSSNEGEYENPPDLNPLVSEDGEKNTDIQRFVQSKITEENADQSDRLLLLPQAVGNEDTDSGSAHKKQHLEEGIEKSNELEFEVKNINNTADELNTNEDNARKGDQNETFAKILIEEDSANIRLESNDKLNITRTEIDAHENFNDKNEQGVETNQEDSYPAKSIVLNQLIVPSIDLNLEGQDDAIQSSPPEIEEILEPEVVTKKIGLLGTEIIDNVVSESISSTKSDSELKEENKFDNVTDAMEINNDVEKDGNELSKDHISTECAADDETKACHKDDSSDQAETIIIGDGRDLELGNVDDEAQGNIIAEFEEVNQLNKTSDDNLEGIKIGVKKEENSPNTKPIDQSEQTVDKSPVDSDKVANQRNEIILEAQSSKSDHEETGIADESLNSQNTATQEENLGNLYEENSEKDEAISSIKKEESTEVTDGKLIRISSDLNDKHQTEASINENTKLEEEATDVVQPDSLDILVDSVEPSMATDSLIYNDKTEEIRGEHDELEDSLTDYKGMDSLNDNNSEPKIVFVDEIGRDEIHIKKEEGSDENADESCNVTKSEEEMIDTKENIQLISKKIDNHQKPKIVIKQELKADFEESTLGESSMGTEFLGDLIDENYASNDDTKTKLKLLTIDAPDQEQNNMYSIQEVDTPITPLTPRPSRLSVEKITNIDSIVVSNPDIDEMAKETDEQLNIDEPIGLAKKFSISLENVQSGENVLSDNENESHEKIDVNVKSDLKDELHDKNDEISSTKVLDEGVNVDETVEEIHPGEMEIQTDSTPKDDIQLRANGREENNEDSKYGYNYSVDIPSSDLSDTETDQAGQKFNESEIDETSRDERDEISEVENFDLSSCGEDSLEAMYYIIRKNEILLDKIHKDEQGRPQDDDICVPVFPEKSTEDLNTAIRAVTGKKSLKSLESVDSCDEVVLKVLPVENDKIDFYLEKDWQDVEGTEHTGRQTESNEEEFLNPIIASIRKNENLLHQMHAKAISLNPSDLTRNVDSGGDSDEIENDSFGDMLIDDMRAGNIQRKILASSTSEADSDYFEKNEPPRRLVKDDFNISTAFDHMTRSTDSESTIESAATKIQAGARGFLTRRRIRRSTSISVEKHSSIGNAAIDKSLDDQVEQQEQRELHETFDGGSSGDSENVLGITEVKVEQRKAYVTTDDTQMVAEEEQYENIFVSQNSEELISVSMDDMIRDTFLLSSPNTEEFKTAKRRMTLQRGDALQRNSTPEEADANKISQEENTTLDLPPDIYGVDGDLDLQSNLIENIADIEKESAGNTPDSDNSAKIEEDVNSGHKKPISNSKLKASRNSARLRTLGPRQRSMPVQIESQLLRVVPKHLRKRVKSANSESRDKKIQFQNTS